MLKATASIVLYNTPEEQLERLLKAIFASQIVERVFLIDNAPPAVPPKFTHPSITYIPSEKNLGYGAGHNVALRWAMDNAEFHFVLNPDIYFGPEAMGLMIHRMEQEPKVGQLMPRVQYPDGSLQRLCKLIPTPFDLLIRRFFVGPLKKLVRKRMAEFELAGCDFDQEMNVPYLSGCFMVFRSSALKKVGLFDERYFMYPEDIDITRRMHASYVTLYYPSATIIHDHAKESYKSWHMLWVHLYNICKYFNKWGWIFDSERSRVNRAFLNSYKRSIS